jgi:peptidoglycan/xylan/chitin deacetylase (PgdA/CDA1 family)
MKKFLFYLFTLGLFSNYAFSSDSIYVARYKGDKACAISYTFDDGLAEQYTLAAPQLEKRGFRGTFCVNGAKVNKDNRYHTSDLDTIKRNVRQRS